MDDRFYGVIPVARGEKDSYLFLLVHRRDGRWVFPRGRVVGSEIPEEAASRELKEQTGIGAFHIIPYLSFSDHCLVEKDGRITSEDVKYFLALVKRQPLVSGKDEIKECKWATFREVLELLPSSSAKSLLEGCIQYLESHKERF